MNNIRTFVEYRRFFRRLHPVLILGYKSRTRLSFGVGMTRERGYQTGKKIAAPPGYLSPISQKPPAFNYINAATMELG